MQFCALHRAVCYHTRLFAGAIAAWAVGGAVAGAVIGGGIGGATSSVAKNKAL